MGISLWNNLGSRNTTLRLRDAVNPRAQAVIAGMRYKRKLLLLTVLMVLMTLAHYLFPGHPRMVALYNNYLFRPYQSLRNLLFGFIPFSVGDVLYLLAFAGAAYGAGALGLFYGKAAHAQALSGAVAAQYGDHICNRLPAVFYGLGG